jgi:hypothetical protein
MKMNLCTKVLLTALLSTSAGMLVMADAPTPVPTPAEPQAQQVGDTSEAEKIQATIREVKGIVQYRTGDDQPWQKVVEGQTLDVGVEFRTGPRSSVTFHLPPDQVITLDRLGTLKLLDAINNADASVATTELGMRYGRTRYQVEGAQDVEHHATIRSPSATLAIRGTQDVTLTDQRPGRASASSRGTRVYFRSTGSPTQVVFGSNNDKSSQSVEEGDSSPGESTSRKRTVDAGPTNARSKTEFELISNYELYNGKQMNNQGVMSFRAQGVRPAATTQPGCCGH